MRTETATIQTINGQFANKLEKASMRKGFGEGLVKAGEANKNVVALCADLAESTQIEPFKNKFPERFVQVGVAEQNLVTVASGLAAMGKIPFAASYAVFSPGRNWEQIRTTICYNNLPVKIVGSHAGLNVGPDGGSHQALEDIALMRVLPNMVVLSPCDAMEARKAAMAAAETNNPTYIRLAREKTPVITSEDTPFQIGKAEIFFRSVNSQSGKNSGKEKACSDIGIIATGNMVYRALLVAQRLTQERYGVTVMNLATIKPLDVHAIIKLAHETRAILTVEEHQIAGGMGSAVAELLAVQFPIPMELVGVHDKFGQSGTAEELLKLYGLDEQHIYESAKRLLIRK